MSTLREIVLDTETDHLQISKIKNLWCIVCKDINSNELFVFSGEDLCERFAVFSKEVCHVIAHNGIEFDMRVLDKFGIGFSSEVKITDTLILSRLLNVGRIGGHSLEAWGHTLQFPKGNYNDFSKFSMEMLEYCKNDVELNAKVYLELRKVIDRNQSAFDRAIRVEHDVQRICLDMHDNGFAFDRRTAETIRDELNERIRKLDLEIVLCFPPQLVKTQLKTKIKEELVHFNPNSPRQIIDKLWEAGWKPVNKTKGNMKNEDPAKKDRFDKYGWVLDETNLATLPDDAPEGLKVLVERRLLQARVNTLTEWLGYYDSTDGRIHGRFNALGARSHRCTHSNPNMGNIATQKTIKYNTEHLRKTAIDLGGKMRSLWICDDDSWLVGTDMESAHLRIFAHMINDEKFTQSLISGKKEDGTDPHSVNKTVLGSACVDRDRAKTFIFSFLNGAAAPKVSQIFGCSLPIAKAALHKFVGAYPGLKRLKQEVFPRDAERGYFIGIDGRKIICDSEHLMMGMALQSTESILMKYYIVQFYEEMRKYPDIKWKLIGWVHDETITEVKGKEEAQFVGQLQAKLIKDVGEQFKMRCPMSGEWKIGKTWLEAH